MFFVKIFFQYLLAVFWIAAGVNHFLDPDFYVNIMPDYMPLHRELVLLSGVTEIAAGLMVAIPALTRWGAWFCIVHLLIFFTVHIDMVVHADKFPEVPITVLWFRLPLQVLFILWAGWFIGGPARRDETAHDIEPAPGA